MTCKLKQLQSSFHLYQCVNESTRISPSNTQSTIDRVFTSDSNLVRSCTIINPLANSDHSSIHISLNSVKNLHSDRKKCRTVWRYGAGDWEKANERLASVPWSTLINSDVNSSWVCFKNIFLDIMEECVPHKRVLMKKNLPWLTKPLVRQIQKRNRLFHAAKKKKDDRDWQKFRRARNKVVKLLRSAKHRYFANLSVQSNPKRFWSTMKLMKGNKPTIPPLFVNGQERCKNSEVLNEFFSKCFNRSLPPLDSQLPFETTGPSATAATRQKRRGT